MARVSDFDRFGVENMSEEEYAAKQNAIISMCICSQCPTYVEGDSPIGYCFPLVGTSKLIHKEVECICERCPVYSEYELTHTFYCTRCSQLCQAYKSELGAGHE